MTSYFERVRDSAYLSHVESYNILLFKLLNYDYNSDHKSCNAILLITNKLLNNSIAFTTML